MKLSDSKFHFIGIGGIGMCGLAELLHRMGAIVTGSDLSLNAQTERLSALGIKIYQGHREENIGDSDVVVFSSAVKPSNPELCAAVRRQIPYIPRAEALAEIMRLKRGVAVAGTHGKTTTTSMVSAIFLHAQKEPTIVVGGRLDIINSTALLGKGEWLIAEADESDGSFHKLTPEISIITNIDNDHLDHFGSFQNLQKSFYDFATKVPFYGVNIICGDDYKVRELFANFSKRIIYYGFNENNEYCLKGRNGSYEVMYEGKVLGEFSLSVPGKHNALNALAAIIVGLSTGISFANCIAGLASYHGVDRRFHFKGEAKDILIYDDYGHHPTEVRATLSAFKEKYPKRRLVVYFQPHRFSRTKSCWDDFLTCFSDADDLLLTDIYPAGESPLVGISTERLVRELQHSNVCYVEKEKAIEKILFELKPNDVFLTLGAGDGWKIGMEVLEILKNK